MSWLYSMGIYVGAKIALVGQGADKAAMPKSIYYLAAVCARQQRPPIISQNYSFLRK